MCPPFNERGSVPQCGRMCVNVGGCAPVCEDVPQCGRVFPSVEGVSLYMCV